MVIYEDDDATTDANDDNQAKLGTETSATPSADTQSDEVASDLWAPMSC